MEDENRKTIKLNIDLELLDKVEDEVARLDTDLSTYIAWCIRSGLYLKDLNSFVRSKKVERR